jgi:formate dehydrogenase major subunit
MIKYVLDDIAANPANYNMLYITEYTNASFLVNTGYKGPAELEGLFSGYTGGSNEADGAKRSYSKTTWGYQVDDKGVPIKDKSLQNPNCVFQLLKKHYTRYTPEKINAICGTPKEAFLEVCRTFASTGKTGKAGVILYAMGTTQHTNGAENIRAYSILQLLLANMGVAGGGIDAMRGESNVQGSTDFGLLFDSIPGYLGMIVDADTTRQKYLDRLTPKNSDPTSLNWLSNYPKYITSLLKAWYGDAATKDNDFGFHYLPKLETGKNYSWLSLFEAMDAGKIKGLMAWGQNPAVGGPSSSTERRALSRLDWLVASDLWMTETMEFWKAPGVDSTKINTEVFVLPALGSFEKEGSITNSGRWMQWRYKAAAGPGEAEDDLWMMNKLMLKLKELYSKEGGPNADAIIKMNWNYGDPPDVHKVAKEINGYDVNTRKQIDGFANLKDDGSTACGEWVYCGSYVEPEAEPKAPVPGNRATRRDLTPDKFNIGLYPGWAWCWPVNRRIIYNRASVDLNGEPFDKEHPVIQWNPTKGTAGGWDGDIPDGGAKPIAQGGQNPFIMTFEGVARLFASGMADGPMPEFYEPWESPVPNQMSTQEFNPICKVWRPEEQGKADKYPIVGTTYRVCEHWQAGQMTRNMPWLNEMMPEPFVEMSEELAKEKGITNGDKIIVESARGKVTMAAMVTKRFKPFQMNGRTVHEVGVLWHWGYTGLSTGDSANILTPHIGDANTMIPEYKAFLVDVRKA